jgi:hypothetical protein
VTLRNRLRILGISKREQMNLKSILLLVFVLFAASCSDSQPNDLLFDSDKWKQGNIRVRGQMVRSLVDQQHILVGKTVAETEELLGEPSVRAKNILTYRISWGSILEDHDIVFRYYLFVELDKATQTVKRLSLGDA